MRLALYIVSAILLLPGALFFLQGMSLVPSRIMFGKQEWVVIGGVMVILGAALAIFARLRVRERT
jgi:hypothetical protein